MSHQDHTPDLVLAAAAVLDPVTPPASVDTLPVPAEHLAAVAAALLLVLAVPTVVVPVAQLVLLLQPPQPRDARTVVFVGPVVAVRERVAILASLDTRLAVAALEISRALASCKRRSLPVETLDESSMKPSVTG